MKTKSRNLLTVILALLCAVAVALGIGLILPKAEKINASAISFNPNFSVIGFSSGFSDGVYMDGGSMTVGRQIVETTATTNTPSGYLRYSVSLVVPAYTQYTVDYKMNLALLAATNTFANSNGNMTTKARIDRYKDSSYSTFVETHYSQQKTLDKACSYYPEYFTVSNLIFTNDTGTSTTFSTYFCMEVECLSKTGGAFKSGYAVGFSPATSTAEVTKLSVPKTTDTITTDYDKNPHTLNFTYADKVTSNDLDGKQHEYAIGYKNVTVTIDAKDGDGNTITAPTLNLDENEGKGSITATDTGTYTVRFNLSPGTISNGIEWVGGGTGEKTIVLTINKIDPKVNPIFGEPEEVDGNPGKWYTSNDLYNDITIETTAGDTAGTISWDASQSLSSGTKNYGWTFTPTDTRNYNKKTGTKSITVESIAIASIKATFNQGTAKFYTSSKLDDLKVKLSVDKVYSDGSTARLANADYELSGDISSAGTATITVTYTSLNTEDPALEEFTDTFEVDITAVAVKSISASFNPTADIYLSNSLEDLKQYLTVNATYNDGKTKNNISNYTLSTDSGALALGTVTVTVTSDEDNTVSDTFEVEVIPDIVPVVLPLPQAKDYTYSGEELDVVGALTTLKEEDVIKYLDVTGTASARRAGIYTVKFKIKDEFIAAGNTSWDVSNLGDLDGVTVSADGNSVEFKWNILKAKVAAKWDSEECLWVPVIVGTLAETTEPNFLINTYTNSDGNEFKNREKLAGGRTYQVTAAVNPQYANDFELDESSQALINSGSETYTYTPPYVPGIWERILNFLKANWLWFVIALAAIILLIVIIVVAKKCHKTKEQREEIKARKEEEKARREEERRLQREKLEAEREIARARQEAELEKMRMQAQAGMAAVAPSVSRGVPSAPEYTGDSSASVSQRERYDGMTRMDNSVLQEIRAELAELRARQNMGAGYPVQPYQQPQGYENNRIAQLEFEVAKIKAEAELKSVGADERMKTMYFSHPSAMPTERFDAADKKGITAELLGEAIMTAFAKFAANNAKPAELPEPEPETAAAQAIYPPDAIVTTTTTVDTTKKTDAAIRREREDTFVDVDGFYDSID